MFHQTTVKYPNQIKIKKILNLIVDVFVNPVDQVNETNNIDKDVS